MKEFTGSDVSLEVIPRERPLEKVNDTREFKERAFAKGCEMKRT